MTKELAKFLSTALVQFVDREQPKDKMCISSFEAKELERCFTEEKFDIVENWYTCRMKPELTEFEKCILDFAETRDEYKYDSKNATEFNNKITELTKSYAKTLLALAKKELEGKNVIWLKDDNYDPLDNDWELGSVGLGHKGYYIPYSDLLKLPKEE